MTLAALLLSLLPLPQSAPAAGAPKEGLAAEDFNKLKKGFGEWIEAWEQKKAEKTDRAEKGEKDAKDRLVRALAEVGKKKGVDPLSLVGDLAKVLEAAVNYKMPETPKGNEVWRKIGKNEKPRYAVRLPKSYLPQGRPWPVLIVIPPPGQEATKHLATAWRSEALRETILVAPEMPAKVEDWRTLGGGVAAAMTMLGDLFLNFRVDHDRVVVGGVGEGGAFAVAWASYYPDRFAGVVSREGGATGAALENLGNLPSYFSGKPEEAKTIAERMKELGWQNATFTEKDELEPIVKWIGERERNYSPTEVAVVPVQDFVRNSYWVRIEGFDPVKDVLALKPEERPILRGKADRATNTIEFQAKRVTDFTLLLSDAILDLDRPIKVVVNGKTWEGKHKRDLDKFLDLFLKRNDPKAIYPANQPFTVPKGEAEKATKPAPKEAPGDGGRKPGPGD
jgi:pimeloyl-ACP methyl ester carboxylesterase